MFFSQVTLNPQRRSTRALVASPQRMHAAVLSCFVPGTAERGRILWRLDSPDRQRLELFVTSPAQPSMESLIDQAGWPGQPTWRSADYGRMLHSLNEGQEWVFRLRANPVVSVRREEGGRGERVPVVRDENLRAWLQQRGVRHGFEIASGEFGPNLRIVEQRSQQFDRRTDGSRRRVTLATAAFEGVLHVTEADALRNALATGIGPAKGYGCGLMTLARR